VTNATHRDGIASNLFRCGSSRATRRLRPTDLVRLQRSAPELAVVAESFHVKPLIRILQSADRYHVLGLNRQQFKLFEGNRDALDEVELDPAVPRTATEVLRGVEGSSPVGLVFCAWRGSASWHGLDGGIIGQ
jgi:Bacterial archaeo-eukaryotic release factor family 6